MKQQPAVRQNTGKRDHSPIRGGVFLLDLEVNNFYLCSMTKIEEEGQSEIHANVVFFSHLFLKV